MTSKSTAFFLVAHGSRRPHAQQALNQLAHYFETRLQAQQKQRAWVDSGCLEFQETPLSQQIITFINTLPSSIKTVRVIPIFLLPGNHVRQDLPDVLQSVQAHFETADTKAKVQLELTPHIGSHPAIKTLLQSKMETFRPDQWILMGHGSRREEGNLSIRQLAKHLQVEPAFWAVPPSLEETIERLSKSGAKTIGVLPFFLFSGKITQMIGDQIDELTAKDSTLDIRYMTPLEPSEALADVLVDLGKSSADINAEWQFYSGAKLQS